MRRRGRRIKGSSWKWRIGADPSDGFAALSRQVARRGKARLDVGIGTWGGAQRGAARLDVGPSLGLVVPVANHNLRLTADWRQRIAGNARPDSGPALSIGTNF